MEQSTAPQRGDVAWTLKRVVRNLSGIVVAGWAGGAVATAVAEAALVIDFSVAACPTAFDARSNSSFLLSTVLLLLIPLGALVAAGLYRRLPVAVWALLGVAGSGSTILLYQQLERVFIAGCG